MSGLRSARERSDQSATREDAAKKGAPSPRERSERHEQGSMTAETVMLAPLFLLFLMFLVGAGRIVEAQGEVNGAARDAARAASVQRTLSDAESAASDAAESSLSGDCSPQVSMSGTDWREGGVVKTTVTCELDLDFLGFGAGKRMSGSAVVPLEQFRRVE
ncbi:TadE/TadG family type IV pilus assembly protein [Microbispora corallina]|uniref:TadE/TadG family type IV pilus assembly protein n=1 Tax=Microbispora corallina TaxID=83302 RepID=UPI001EF222E0|nr:TadE/TadG family type IV pilus assembly protein [Microbispora corallina]